MEAVPDARPPLLSSRLKSLRSSLFALLLRPRPSVEWMWMWNGVPFSLTPSFLLSLAFLLFGSFTNVAELGTVVGCRGGGGGGVVGLGEGHLSWDAWLVGWFRLGAQIGWISDWLRCGAVLPHTGGEPLTSVYS